MEIDKSLYSFTFHPLRADEESLLLSLETSICFPGKVPFDSAVSSKRFIHSYGNVEDYYFIMQ